jgi:hypothetical protein
MKRSQRRKKRIGLIAVKTGLISEGVGHTLTRVLQTFPELVVSQEPLYLDSNLFF